MPVRGLVSDFRRGALVLVALAALGFSFSQGSSGFPFSSLLSVLLFPFSRSHEEVLRPRRVEMAMLANHRPTAASSSGAPGFVFGQLCLPFRLMGP